jgi:hypothetical protein
MENAAIYKFKKTERFIIHSLSKLIMGASIATEPFIVLEGSTPIEEIAKQLMSAMSCSKINLPNPRDWNVVSNEFLSSMGFKRNKDLHDNSILVNVYKNHEAIVFNPTINLGAKEGFRNIPDKIIKLGLNEDITQISKVLQESLYRCE